MSTFGTDFGDIARICKHLRSPGIDSKESVPPAYVAWRAATSNRVVVPARQAVSRFLGPLEGLQIRAQERTVVGSNVNFTGEE